MTFTRRSRKGKIHVVRERVKKGYRYTSNRLREANELTTYLASNLARDVGRGLKETGKELGYPPAIYWRTLGSGVNKAKDSFNSGVNSIHRSSQRALAKGHQSLQSGLKKIQQNTGDFNMQIHYQYQPPVAMFSMAEVDKYNRYADGEMAYFAGAKPPSQVRQDLGRVGGALKRAPGGAYRAAKGAVGGTYRAARGAAKGGYGLARGAVKGGYGLARKGLAGGAGLAGAGAQKLGSAAATGLGMGSVGLSKLSDLAGVRAGRTGALIAGAAALGAAGAGGSMFMRRRRTKSGKIVVENVRR